MLGSDFGLSNAFLLFLLALAHCQTGKAATDLACSRRIGQLLSPCLSSHLLRCKHVTLFQEHIPADARWVPCSE